MSFLVQQSKRTERERVAAGLRERGLLLREIATEMGISIQYVHDLLSDPGGLKLKARRARYAGVCEDCGAPTHGHDGHGPRAARRCRSCDQKLISGRQEALHHERRDKLARLYLSGLPLRRIAEEMGWSAKNGPNTVSVSIARLRRYGYDLPPRRLALSEKGGT